MNLLNLLKKRKKEDTLPKTEEATPVSPKIYSGMRVEVTLPDGQFLFVAKLMNLHETTGELHQYSEIDIGQEGEPIQVRIRGYNDHERKAFHMEGSIAKMPNHIWQVSQLAVTQGGKERAFFRLTTNIDATATMFSGLMIGEKPCKLLNISIGGACIASQYEYHENDKFLLKVRLLEDRPESAMFCQILRVIKKEESKFEYGCCFLELREEDQDKIAQNIYAAQLQKRVTS